VSAGQELPPFANEPALELRRAPVREALQEALRELDRKLPLTVPVTIGGDTGSAHGIASTDPGAPARLVAHAGRATDSDAADAVAAAERGFRDWSARPAAERASVLRGAAEWVRERRLELAALEVRECAKPWPEADADVCEAIDYLEYYARGALALERGRELLQLPGERNTMRYAPRGVAAVISPWNFPLAIPTGMTAAGLAAGNAVVLKPAEQSPACALMLVRALHEAGVPADALGLLPGYGDAGAALVRDACGPAARQARGLRDGRQELRDRRLGRRPGRRSARDRPLGLHLRGTEVLGGLPRARP
jgi:RHH-type proline utilization regulon transcriptional repressor/proline dehydrogenase/delta 1-pyrroline-5-carboxylate dehydrogenase